MIVPTCRCAFFAAVMLLGVFMSDIAPANNMCIVCVCQFFLRRASQEGVHSSCQHVFAARSCFEYQH